MSGYSITEAQSATVHAVLEDLRVQADADAVFMSDLTGHTLAQVPAASAAPTPNIAALAAGSFCATRALSALLGEPGFHATFHHGRDTSLYLCSAATDFLLLVVFGRRTEPGLVRLYAARAARELEPLLRGLLGQEARGPASPRGPFVLDPRAALFDEADPAATEAEVRTDDAASAGG